MTLWVNWHDQSDFHWDSLGRPNNSLSIIKSMGVVNVEDKHYSKPYAFVECDDGNVWVKYWDLKEWNWVCLKRPGGANGPFLREHIGSIVVDKDRPYIFVKGHSGDLKVLWWKPTEWTWSDLGLPSGVTIAKPLGALSVKTPSNYDRPYVFILGNDGNVWLISWDFSDWNWINLEKPSGSISDAMGAITVNNDQSAILYVRTTSGRLWMCIESEQWKWVDLG